MNEKSHLLYKSRKLTFALVFMHVYNVTRLDSYWFLT